jgi:hypothetical protein
MVEHFDSEELRILVHDLGVNWDDLPGERISAKSNALIIYLDRRGRLPELVSLLREERRHIPWPDAPPSTTGREEETELESRSAVLEGHPAAKAEVTVKKVAKLLKPHDKDGHVIVDNHNLIFKTLMGREIVRFPVNSVGNVEVTRTTLIPAVRFTVEGKEHLLTFFRKAQAQAVADAIKLAQSNR